MESLYQRDVFGQTLVDLGKRDEDIIVFDADLSTSTRSAMFAKEFPGRFFNFGIAEQNMMAAAAGMSSCGKTVFVSTFAIFASGRAWDQVRNSIVYNNFDVKIVATHAGVTVGPDGASHQAIEDIALMSVLPNMNIIVPCDGPQTREAIEAAYGQKGPFYIRLGRPKVPSVEIRRPFVFGKAQVLMEGSDIALIACGIMVQEALLAAEELRAKGIAARVINMHTIKPLDTDTVIKAAHETKGIVVCEEHLSSGGLSAVVAQAAAEYAPARVVSISIKNRFGQSGEPAELLKEYNLTGADIAAAALGILG